MILWRKTQSKKMMRYVNKQNFCVSYMDAGRQKKKRVVLPPYWRESLHIAASITSIRNPNLYPCILTNSNLFQPKAEVSTNYPNDVLCVNMLKSPTLYQMRRNLPTPLGNRHKVHRRSQILVDDESKYLAWYPLVEVC